MGRQYNNRQSTRTHASAPNQFLVMTITFLLGYFVATVCDLETITNWINTQILAHHEGEKAPAQPQEAQRQAAIPPKPKFEFYTLLANEKVPNSEKPAAATHSTAVQTAAVNTATTTVNKSGVTKAQLAVAIKVAEAKPVTVTSQIPTSALAGRGTYSVQVASFKARHDAEHMKGLLTLKGFNVNVVPINHATRGVWFRVVVGPYANRTLAQKAQIDLARNERLRGMLTAG
ncbi:MAG: SPOR domain-containing protein [Legionella sp.]|uniref:SPOR domain-containing protein n=1 Tax=Legionella sp. TaxID=459 RepID=UPI0039E5A975